MQTLFVVIASTRPGRAGEPIGRWIHEEALAHARFAPEIVDLADVGLPALDEPHHPRLGRYTKDHTRAWSERVSRADAFAFVTPEYNHGPAPALVNALAFLYAEWTYKAAGLVSYGGVSGGTRSAEVTKQMLTTLRMVVPFEAVHIPFVHDRIVEGRFAPSPELDQAAALMFDELARLTTALATLRPAPPALRQPIPGR
jgi:NAD(P)H-dependent FMN reductase